MIAIHKYTFSDADGRGIENCDVYLIYKGETVKELSERIGLGLGGKLRTNERIEIRYNEKQEDKHLEE